jgi:protein O-mannosyl-transferase
MARKRTAQGTGSARRPPEPTTIAAADPAPTALLYALLLVVTLAAYYPAWHGGMLWDDDAHVTKPELQPAAGLWRIWFDVGATAQYYPVVHSAFWVLHSVFGDDLFGYHLVNILLHATSAFLFAVILTRLAVPGAMVAAFIFALHPVHVESVAWVTELKNTLSGVLFLTAVLSYLKFDAERRRGACAAAFALFVLALLSKSVTAVLPGVLLVVFWWKRGTLRWREDARPLVPFMAVGVVSGLATAWIERVQIGAEGAPYQLTIVERGLIAGRAIWFYLGKLLWPSDLVFSYPRWPVSQAVWWQYLPPLGVVALAAAAWAWRRRSRAPLAILLLFVGMLFPALGFFNVYPFRYSFVADHFQYLASLAIIPPLAAAIAFASAKLPMDRRQATAIAILAVAAPAAALTWRQCHQYTDAETLYNAILERNPSSWMARSNLGRSILLRAGESGSDALLEDAAQHFRTALQLKPDFPQAHNNLGTTLLRLRRFDEAKAEYRAALALKPQDAEVRQNLALAYGTAGNALLTAGRVDAAVAEYRQALEFAPAEAETHHNLASALARLGHTDEAIVEYREALRINPGSLPAHRNLGLALLQTGKQEEAIAEFREALRLRPDLADVHNALGTAFAELGQYDAAIAAFTDALRYNPELDAAGRNLARAQAERAVRR